MEKFIETSRVYLRNFCEDDLMDFNEYAKVEGVGEMAGWPAHKSIEATKQVLDIFIKEKDTYAIVDKVTDKVIGSFSFHELSDKTKEELGTTKCIEPGYVLSKSFWGQGIMPEILNTAIEYIFTQTDIELIHIVHFKDNMQSQSVILKSGFKYYADGTFNSRGLNKEFSVKRYKLLKEEYKK